MPEKEQQGKRTLRVICSYCKRSLDGQHAWDVETEEWFEKTGGVSHGICPDCLLYHFPAEYLAIQEEGKIRIRNLFKKGFTKLYGHK